MRSELPIPPLVDARPGVYEAQLNPLGAISVETPTGPLGIKPGECEFATSEDEAEYERRFPGKSYLFTGRDPLASKLTFGCAGQIAALRKMRGEEEG